MKYIYKILILGLIIILSFFTISYGFGLDELQGDTIQDYVFIGIGNNILGVLTTIGMYVSVIILIILGIKYMMGSAEEKAEYKKSLMPYVIGAGLVFSASAIAQIIYDLAIQI